MPQAFIRANIACVAATDVAQYGLTLQVSGGGFVVAKHVRHATPTKMASRQPWASLGPRDTPEQEYDPAATTKPLQDQHDEDMMTDQYTGDGGPAQPIVGPLHDVHGTGLSIRDHFAGLALAALIGHPNKDGCHRGKHAVPVLAGFAYEYADAMLRARKVAP